LAWFILFVAALFETGWPLGLKLAGSGESFRPLPAALAAAAMVVSGVLLYLAQRTIPMGTAYAVWTGFGTIGTFLLGVFVFKEAASAARIACIALIAAGIVGFKLFSDH
jgi:quaternary ammonium compound-resistance protein SugE